MNAQKLRIIFTILFTILFIAAQCPGALITRVKETERFKTYKEDDDLVKFLRDMVIWNEKTYAELAGRTNWLIDRDEIRGDLKLTGDEKAVFWYNGTNYWKMLANGSLAADYTVTWPAIIGTTGQQLTGTVSGNTLTLSMEDPGGLGGVGDIDAVGDVTTGSAFTGSDAGNNLYFEGSTVDDIETKLTVVDPTGTDKTITFPNGDIYFPTGLPVEYGGSETTSLTDGGVLLGSGTGAITPMAVLADGEIIVGDGAADPVALAAFTSSTGDLKHESGGLEADINAYTGLLAVSGGSTSEVDALSELEGQIADVTAFVVEGTACSNVEGTGLSITAETLNWAAAHSDLSDMPDSTGVITDHDTRLVAKVQTGTPVTPTPFPGMFWYDTDATGSSVSSTVNLVTKTTTYTITADDVFIVCNGTFTVTLPTAVGITGKMYWIKNIGNGTITIDGDGSETIDGAATAVMRRLNPTVPVVSDGTGWLIF